MISAPLISTYIRDHEGCVLFCTYLSAISNLFSQVVSILIEFSKSLGKNIPTVATDSYNGQGWKKRLRLCYKTGRFYYLGEGWDGINGQSFLVSSQATEG